MDGIKCSAESRLFTDVSELIVWVFGEFCINLHVSFLVKSPQTLSCFLKQLIHSQHTLQVTICPVTDPALFKANTPLWAAVGTSSMKAQQAPECVGAHQWTLGHSKEPAVCWWSNHPLSSWLLGEGSAPQCYTDNLSDAEMLVSYIFACELGFYSYGGFLCLEACKLFLTHNLGEIL